MFYFEIFVLKNSQFKKRVRFKIKYPKPNTEFQKEINLGFWSTTFSVQPTSSNPVNLGAAVQSNGATSFLTMVL